MKEKEAGDESAGMGRQARPRRRGLEPDSCRRAFGDRNLTMNKPME